MAASRECRAHLPGSASQVQDGQRRRRPREQQRAKPSRNLVLQSGQVRVECGCEVVERRRDPGIGRALRGLAQCRGTVLAEELRIEAARDGQVVDRDGGRNVALDFLQFPEIDVRDVEVRPQVECAPEGFAGFPAAPQNLQRGTAIVVDLGVVRVQSQGCIEGGERIACAPCVAEEKAQGVVNFRIGGIQCASAFQEQQRLRKAAIFEAGIAFRAESCRLAGRRVIRWAAWHFWFGYLPSVTCATRAARFRRSIVAPTPVSPCAEAGARRRRRGARLRCGRCPRRPARG